MGSAANCYKIGTSNQMCNMQAVYSSHDYTASIAVLHIHPPHQLQIPPPPSRPPTPHMPPIPGYTPISDYLHPADLESKCGLSSAGVFGFALVYVALVGSGVPCSEAQLDVYDTWVPISLCHVFQLQKCHIINLDNPNCTFANRCNHTHRLCKYY